MKSKWSKIKHYKQMMFNRESIPKIKKKKIKVKKVRKPLLSLTDYLSALPSADIKKPKNERKIKELGDTYEILCS